jgi:hypothetical protein
MRSLSSLCADSPLHVLLTLLSMFCWLSSPCACRTVGRHQLEPVVRPAPAAADAAAGVQQRLRAEGAGGV